MQSLHPGLSSSPPKPFPVETPQCRDPIRKTAVSYAAIFCDDQLKKRLRRKNRIGRQRHAKKSQMAPRNGDDPDNCIIIQLLEFNSKKQILIGIVS